MITMVTELLHEQAPNQGSLSGVSVGQQLRQPLAEVINFPVKASYVVAGLLQYPSRWYLHVHVYPTQTPIPYSTVYTLIFYLYVQWRCHIRAPGGSCPSNFQKTTIFLWVPHVLLTGASSWTMWLELWCPFIHLILAPPMYMCTVLFSFLIDYVHSNIVHTNIYTDISFYIYWATNNMSILRRRYFNISIIYRLAHAHVYL